MYNFIFNNIYITDLWYYNYNIYYLDNIYWFNYIYFNNLDFYNLNYIFINYDLMETNYIFINNIEYYNKYKYKINYIYLFLNIYILFFMNYIYLYLYNNLIMILTIIIIFIIIYHIYLINYNLIIYIYKFSIKLYNDNNDYDLLLNYYDYFINYNKYLYDNYNINLIFIYNIYQKYILNKEYIYKYYYENYYIQFKITINKYLEIIKINILTYKIFGIYFRYITETAIFRDDLRVYKKKKRNEADGEEKIKQADIFYLLETYKFFMINILVSTIFRIFNIIIKSIIYITKFLLLNKIFKHNRIIEILKLNKYINIYLYIYISKIINKEFMNKFFIIQEYTLYEYIIHVYDLINTWIITLLEIINPFFKNKFGVINKSTLDSNNIKKNRLLNWFNNLFYNLIYLTNNNKLNNYFIILKTLLKYLFLIFFIIFINIINIIYYIIFFISYLIKNIYFNKKFYYFLLKYNNKISHFYKKKKNNNKIIILFFIFIILLFNIYFYNILINILLLYLIITYNKNIYFIIGYLYFYTYDFIKILIIKITKLIYIFLKKTKYLLILYLLYEFEIFSINNTNIIEYFYYNIRNDIIDIMSFITKWYNMKPDNLILDTKLLYFFILEEKNIAKNQIFSHFGILWENLLISFPKFKWELFTYDNIMNKWLNLDNIDFITVSMYYLKNIFNTIRYEVNLFFDDVKFYIWRFWLMKPLMKFTFMFYYYYCHSLLSYYIILNIINYIDLIYIYIYLHFKYIYIYLIPYYLSSKYCFIIFNIYSLIYKYYIYLYPNIYILIIYLYNTIIIPIEYIKYIIIYIYFIIYNILNIYYIILDIYNKYLILLEIKYQSWLYIFIYYNLKIQLYIENLQILIFNVFRFSIYNWNLYEPATEFKTNIRFDFYWNTYYSQEEITKKYEEGNDLSEFNMSSLDFFNINPKRTKYFDYSKKWYYIYKDIYNWIEYYYIYLNNKNNIQWSYNMIKYKIINLFSLYFLLEYIILWFLFIKLHSKNHTIYNNDDYIWKQIKNELNHELLDNKNMQKYLNIYKRRDKEKEYSINLFIEYLNSNINKYNYWLKRIIKKKNIIKSFKKNIKYYYKKIYKINIDNIENINKKSIILKNYIIEKNIYFYYRNNFPIKTYLISQNYNDYYNGFFNNDNKFYFLFSKIKNKNKKLLFLFNDELLKLKKTIINYTDIDVLIYYINKINNIFFKIDSYYFNNNGPQWLINKNLYTLYPEKNKYWNTIKHAKTIIVNEEFEHEIYFYWIFLLPLIYIFFFKYNIYTFWLRKTSRLIVSKSLGFLIKDLIINTNFFYNIQFILDWLSNLIWTSELKVLINKHYLYKEVDFLHRSKKFMKSEKHEIYELYSYIVEYNHNIRIKNNYFLEYNNSYAIYSLYFKRNIIVIFIIIYYYIRYYIRNYKKNIITLKNNIKYINNIVQIFINYNINKFQIKSLKKRFKK